MTLFLSFEAHDLLINNYENIDFESHQETLKAYSKLRGRHDEYGKYNNNYVDFLKYIKRLLKSNKVILSLYLMSNYCAWGNKAEARLLADTYIEAFIHLKRFDILSKYYSSFEVLYQNAFFLQSVMQHFIEEKQLNNAEEALEKLAYIEPSNPYIEEAKKQIEILSLIKKMLSKNIDIKKIDKMSGQEFERLLVGQFEKLGFKTKETPVTGDFGADIIVETEDETKFVIQCKRFKSRVNLKAVQEVSGALAHFNGDIGIVITNSTFLSSAIKLAKSNDIELWGKNELMKFLTGDISFSQIGNS